MTYETEFTSQGAAVETQLAEIPAAVGITELTLSDLRHVSGGAIQVDNWTIDKGVGAKPLGFVLNE